MISLTRVLLPTGKLLSQGLLVAKLKLLLTKFYFHQYDLVSRYGISVSQMTADMFQLVVITPVISKAPVAQSLALYVVCCR
jgi:hypothetical protein